MGNLFRRPEGRPAPTSVENACCSAIAKKLAKDDVRPARESGGYQDWRELRAVALPGTIKRAGFLNDDYDPDGFAIPLL